MRRHRIGDHPSRLSGYETIGIDHEVVEERVVDVLLVVLRHVPSALGPCAERTRGRLRIEMQVLLDVLDPDAAPSQRAGRGAPRRTGRSGCWRATADHDHVADLGQVEDRIRLRTRVQLDGRNRTARRGYRRSRRPYSGMDPANRSGRWCSWRTSATRFRSNTVHGVMPSDLEPGACRRVPAPRATPTLPCARW